MPYETFISPLSPNVSFVITFAQPKYFAGIRVPRDARSASSSGDDLEEDALAERVSGCRRFRKGGTLSNGDYS
jgi:hypothetical protein